ncbi:MAG: hypothetical protein ACRD59_09475 [Candidatus Acidiferrales bacterium]
MIGHNSSILAAVLAFTSVALLAQDQPNKRLWVLQKPGAIVEYDAATFAPRRTQKIPAEIFKSPQDLQINQQGQMLFLPGQVQESGGLVHEYTDSKFWFWDGSSGTSMHRPLSRSTTSSGTNKLVETAMPRCYLSKDGTHLFWFENRMKKLMPPDLGVDLSVNTTFRGWQTDLSGGQPEKITSESLPTCKCETGSCSESCPEVAYWVPEEGVSDFFLATHWIPGQIQPEYQDSFLYRRSAGKWSASKLPAAVEQILDFASDANGVGLIEAARDAGCCGWENESDDQTLLTKNGKTTLLFDEFKRYQNQDYDVSFFTSTAKLAPNAAFVAFTVVATQNAGTEIRLSDSGKPNPGELARIQKALAELPQVEVVGVGDPPKPVARMAHAMLVGWINDQEILLVENDFLVAFNVTSGTRRVSNIKMAKESHAFLR